MRFSNIFAAALAVALVVHVWPAEAASPRVKLRAELGQSAIVAGADNRVFLRVDLEGMPFERREHRTPVNIAIVIDRSGSMRGAKLAHAKEAAIMALERLAPDDFVSVVAYAHTVDVIVPATRMTRHGQVRRRIEALRAGGQTALYAGVKEGLHEVREHLGRNRVNRLILISDGLANVGPSSPKELGELGLRAAQDGISITTIGLGLGYNEDLMAKLAFNSDGNHAFVEHPADLVRIFNQEFGDALSVVAQDVEVDIDCPPGIRPMRALGRKAKIEGGRISFRVNQLYGAQRKYAIVELEVPKNLDAGTRALAKVRVAYRDMATQRSETLTQETRIRITTSRREAEASANKDVLTAVATQTAVEQNERAVTLRDKGRVDEARQVLRDNAAYLKRQSERLGSTALSKMKDRNLDDERQLAAPGAWTKHRKTMRAEQYRSKTQQSY